MSGKYNLKHKKFILLFLFEIEFRLCSGSQSADVLVVTGDHEDACYCHDYKRYGVVASENEEHDGKQHRKAHRCHRHKANGKENDYKDGKADKSCAPIDKPYASKEGKNRLSTLEIVPYGERVSEHTTKECGSCGKLPFPISILHYKLGKQYGKNGFANINRHYAKGCGGKSVKSLEIGKAGVFTTKLTDILAINQAREDNGAVDTAQKISKYGKCRTIQI